MPKDNVVSVTMHIIQGQVEDRLDRLTAACLIHGVDQQVLDNVQALHHLVRRMRKHLQEEQRMRLRTELQESVDQIERKYAKEDFNPSV